MFNLRFKCTVISRHSVRSWETVADILRRCEMLGM